MALRRLWMDNADRRRQRLVITWTPCRCKSAGSNPAANTTAHRQRAYHPINASARERRPDRPHREALRGELGRRGLPVHRDRHPREQTLAGFEARGIDYMARVRNNAVLNRTALPSVRLPESLTSAAACKPTPCPTKHGCATR